MPMIEKNYSGFDDLHDFIKANLPDWMSYVGDIAQYSLYGVSADGTEENIKGTEWAALKIGREWTDYYVSMIYINEHSDRSGVDYESENQGSSNTNSRLSNNQNGIVRIVKSERAWGICLLNSSYAIRTGAAIAYSGNVSDGKFYTFIGTSNTDTSKGIVNLVAQTMLDDNNRIRTSCRNYAKYNVLAPFCDWQHGATEPLADIFISMSRTSALPAIVYHGTDKYYRITASGDYDCPPIYMKG